MNNTKRRPAKAYFSFNSEITGFRLEQVGFGTIELTKDPNNIIEPSSGGAGDFGDTNSDVSFNKMGRRTNKKSF